jgi:hypothetical protein
VFISDKPVVIDGMMHINLKITIAEFKNTYLRLNIEESTKVSEIYGKMFEKAIK